MCRYLIKAKFSLKILETTESTPVSTGSVPATGMNAWIYSITFTVLIAFAIMIILYVISRASRRKIVN